MTGDFNQPDPNRRYWLDAARNLQFRFNLALCLDLFLRAVTAISAAAAAAILICRHFGYPTTALAWAFAGLLAASLIFTVIQVRSKLIDRARALIRLDEAYGLNSRLTSAQAGVGTFPAAPAHPAKLELPYTWNLARLALLIAIPAVLILSASMVPLPRAAVAAIAPKQPPIAVAEVQKLLEKLEKDAVVEKRDLNELKQQAESITKQNPEQWYDQHSLEAADTLKEKTEGGAESLAHSLEQASKALGQLSDAMKQASPEMKQELKAQLDKAIKQLEEGSMHPSDELAKSLSELSKASPDSIPQELMDSIKGKLKSSAKILKEDLKKGGAGGEEKSGGQNGDDGQGKDNKESECDGSSAGGMCSENGKKSGGKDGQGMGSQTGPGQEGPGSVSRGPGAAPLNLKEHSPQLTSPRTEQLSSKSGAKNPGDLVGMTSQTPQVDQKNLTERPAGAPGASAAGGEAVSNGVYTPDESEVLKKYFR